MHTDFRAWFGEVSRGVRDGAVRDMARSGRGLFNGLYYSVTTRRPIGTNIFERDWDLLIVLDACRLDALREVAPEYEFIEDVDSIWSVGSSSHEWICKTFTNDYLEEIQETVHVTTNPFIPQVFDDRVFPPKAYSIPLMWADWDVVEKSAFKKMLKVHRHDYEDYFVVSPPETVTDYAIDLGRRHEFDRMVVHYFQPHTPYIHDAFRERRPLTDVEDNPWRAVDDGIATYDEIWDLYLDNLRFVLGSIRTLLQNVDAPDVVITADHGDLFGELGVHGHPEGVVHPNLKKVPWATATATDEGGHVPDVDEADQTGSAVGPEERLKNLGYL
jgi:hypothetical protein